MEAAVALTVREECLRVRARFVFLSEKFGKEEIEVLRFGLSEERGREVRRLGLMAAAVVLRRRRREGRVVVSAKEAMTVGVGSCEVAVVELNRTATCDVIGRGLIMRRWIRNGRWRLKVEYAALFVGEKLVAWVGFSFVIDV